MQKRFYFIASVLIASFVIMFSTIFNNYREVDVKFHQLTKEAQTQVLCLADNIYHEAGYESTDGKIAVGMVTMNRTQDPKFPKDICSVVKQKVNYTCQFSWMCEQKSTDRKRGAYESALEIALYVYANYEHMTDVTKGALYYHADYVNPQWKLHKTAVIGRHIFYKEKGGV